MHREQIDASCRRGFTLVEMLVAVGLVMLMMVLFAQTFGTAVSTMRAQRSIANNDQQARALTALLRSDLEAATYKSQLYSDSPGLIPLMANDIVDPNQRGYFYIAENVAQSDSDDILQFTIWVEEPLSGRAQPIGRPDGSGPNLADLNQPDGDDGILGNGTTWSRAAEVCYFLRNGTLYRRVLLLRDALPHNPSYPNQPTLATTGQGADVGGTYYDRLMPLGYDASADVDAPLGDFWNDFDSSACWVYNDYVGSWQIHFNSIDSLDNHRGTENHPLGIPHHRFGHDPGFVNPGIPMEGVNTPSGLTYIGRFTHEETSSPAFGYPGPASDPFTYDDSTGHTFINGVVADYAGGPRAGEDIVMSGVEAFDIELLDEGWTLDPADRADGGYPKFVDLAKPPHPPGFGPDLHNEFAGDFALGVGTHNPDYYTPGLVFPGFGSRFDTWHPSAEVGMGVTPEYPPCRPYYHLGIPWPPLGMTVTATDVARPSETSAGASIAYRPVSISGPVGDVEPEWPGRPGARVTDGGVIWEAFDNRIGLKMIRITIRYVDPQTGGLRQLSINHSFVESR